MAKADSSDRARGNGRDASHGKRQDQRTSARGQQDAAFTPRTAAARVHSPSTHPDRPTAFPVTSGSSLTEGLMARFAEAANESAGDSHNSNGKSPNTSSTTQSGKDASRGTSISANATKSSATSAEESAKQTPLQLPSGLAASKTQAMQETETKRKTYKPPHMRPHQQAGAAQRAKHLGRSRLNQDRLE